MLTEINRSALVSYSAQAMYNLVNDVPAYPQYMSGCIAAEVLEQGEDFMIAKLELGKGGIRQSFTTRNQLMPGRAIEMSIVEGPFRRLSGVWKFEALGDEACKVSLDMAFEPKNRLTGFAAASLFASVANDLVSALARRADAVYGQAA